MAPKNYPIPLRTLSEVKEQFKLWRRARIGVAEINIQRLRQILVYFQGVPKGAYFRYVTFDATLKADQKTSRIVDLFVSGALNNKGAVSATPRVIKASGSPRCLQGKN